MFDQDTYQGEAFKDVNLVEGVVQSVTFEDCTFSHCDFSKTAFRNTKFNMCNFENCNLALAKLEGCALIEVNFLKSKLTGMKIISLEGLLNSFDFQECNLDYIDFTKMDLKSRGFVNCSLIEAYFSECNLTKADFARSDLKGATFTNCDLREASFVTAFNYFIDTNANKVYKAKFSLPEAASLLKNLGVIITEPPAEQS